MRLFVRRPRVIADKVNETEVTVATATPKTINTPQEAVEAWKRWSSTFVVATKTGQVPWAAYLYRKGARKPDERTVVAPFAFLDFAANLLGWEPGVNLATEISGDEGRPDFVPADAVTHPFVFEIKGTEGAHSIGSSGEHDEQVTRYLRDGGPRIRRVVLTNLHGIKVYSLVHGALDLNYSIDLNYVNTLSRDYDANEHANNLLRFFREFKYRSLTGSEKVERIRSASAWSPLEVTNSSWVTSRISSVVSKLTTDAQARIDRDLSAWARLDANNRAMAITELQTLELRAGADDKALKTSISDYLTSGTQTARDARTQFIQNTAFYVMTRLLLVRVWEDVGLIHQRLIDGGFDKVYKALDNLEGVVNAAYSEAAGFYPSLFSTANPYVWFRPAESVLIDVLYDLANTYLGELNDDILGDVYQQQLALTDRKRLGQYYTPRSVIDLILNEVHPQPAKQDEPVGIPRIYDFATGSGGFLVKQAHKEKERLLALLESGAELDEQDIICRMADSLVGTEISQFSAYLTEVNLLLQMSPLLARDSSLAIPHLAIFRRDSLKLHNPEKALPGSPTPTPLERLRDPKQFDSWFDGVVGNPPYVGEKSSAARQAALKKDAYWQGFSAAHQDYLYFFLILAISKLRRGGRFGFITTEYWLKATGAKPLRRFIAEQCRVERLFLFRNLTLFPDAPGQHNLVIIGERVTDPVKDEEPAKSRRKANRPRISVYRGTQRTFSDAERAEILEVLARARKNVPGKAVETFKSQRDIRSLGGASWAEVIMTQGELARREALTNYPAQAGYDTTEGIVAPPQRLKSRDLGKVTPDVIENFNSRQDGLGIFVLKTDEYESLRAQGLTPEEVEAIKPVVNTRHIYPYASVLPKEHEWLIWLPYRGRQAFPTNMPHLKAHLQSYKSLLEAKLAQYHATRPWWSVHNPRTDFVDKHAGKGRWADMAATARWGDRKLVTGLLPHGALPLSGMHLLAPHTKVDAAYMVGLIHSDPVQALADALAPGSYSQEDLMSLGFPAFPLEARRQVAKLARDLARQVTYMVTTLSQNFPLTGDALRADPTMTGGIENPWRPHFSPRTASATPRSAIWIAIEETKPLVGRVTGVDTNEDMYGFHVRVTAEHGCALLTPDPDERRMLEALADYCRASLGNDVNELLGRPIHLSASDFLRSHDHDVAHRDAKVADYVAARTEINTIVAEELARKP